MAITWENSRTGMIFARLPRLLHEMLPHLLSVDGILTLHGVWKIETFERNALLGIVRRYFASIWNDFPPLDLCSISLHVTGLPKRGVLFAKRRLIGSFFLDSSKRVRQCMRCKYRACNDIFLNIVAIVRGTVE